MKRKQSTDSPRKNIVPEEEPPSSPAKKVKKTEDQEEEEEEEEDAKEAAAKSACSKVPRKRKRKVFRELVKQMEFYFSDANLSKSKFMMKLVGKGGYRWVDLDIFLKFNKLTTMMESGMGRTELDDLWRAMSKVGSESELLETREDPETGKRQVRRKREFVAKTPAEIESCTIYVENLPSSTSHDDLRSLFSRFGEVVYVSLPRFSSGQTKGFAFLEFSDPSTVERALSSFGTAADAKAEMEPEDLSSIRAYQKELKEKAMEVKPAKKDDAEEDKDDEAQGDVSKDGPNADKVGANGDRDETSACPPPGENVQKDKKSKRKRGPRGLSANAQFELDLCAASLTVMSKKSWKKLRNTYLDLQKKNMGKAKKRLRRWQEKRDREAGDDDDEEEEEEQASREQEEDAKKGGEEEEEEKGLELVPGTVVKFESREPVTDRKLLKKKVSSAFLDGGGVRYVDVAEGSRVFHVRCATEEQATRLSKAVGLSGEGGTAAVLQGEEEKEYCTKAREDWKQKRALMARGRRTRPRKGEEGHDGGERKRARRGKEKLSCKLDERQGTHKYFNEDD